MQELNDYLQGQIQSLRPFHAGVFRELLEEFWNRTRLEEFSPLNSEREINFLKAMSLDNWGTVDLWEIETAGIEFNLQAEFDNDPDMDPIIWESKVTYSMVKPLDDDQMQNLIDALDEAIDQTFEGDWN